MKRAMVFPGQGSQAVGMGCELAVAFPAARRLFDEVDEALSQPLSRLMFDGPESELTLTENAQPALMAASLAVIRVLEAEAGLELGRHVAYVAGHSLGEYSALAAAGALGVGDAARLLRLRGRAMQRAVPVGEGAMAALIGFDAAAAHAVAAAATRPGLDRDEICAVANDNAPGQVVLSGHRGAVERAIAIARERGARRAVMLAVSAPFHSPLLAPGRGGDGRSAGARDPALAGGAARRQCVGDRRRRPRRRSSACWSQQVTAMVRWRESVLFLADAGSRRSSRSAPGRCSPGSPSASRPTSPPARSAPPPRSGR